MPKATFFISAVTNEYGSYRGRLRAELERPGVKVEVQETFLPFGDRVLLELDDYIQKCNAVIQLSGAQAGSVADAPNLTAIFDRYPDLPARLGVTEAFLRSLSYTQWEAWLALLHGKRIHIAPGLPEAAPDKPIADPALAEAQRVSQRAHLAALEGQGFYASEKLAFANADKLVIALLRALHDFLPAAGWPISPELPPSLGSLFKGRDDDLTAIHQAFEKARPRGGVDCRPVAIWGTAGLGKTRLAAEYAHTFAHRHTALLFVSAASEEDLTNGLANLCGALKLGQAGAPELEVRLRAALDWLDNPDHKGWFLILDNVDDEAAMAAVESRLRTLHHGRVVLTGRLRDWPAYVEDLHLDVLSRDHATEFLLDYTEGRRVEGRDDRVQAGDLASELGDLALALTQAAYHINKRALSLEDYRAEWRTNRDELLDDPWFDPMRTNYPRTLAVTWKTSFDQLPPASAVLFEALCWLAADPVPERLVSQEWPDDALATLPTEIARSLPRRRADLLVPLYDFCLAEAPRTTARTFTIHRVLQDVGRRWQRKRPDGAEIMNKRFALATAITKADFVRPDTIENLTLHVLPLSRQTAPHVLELLAATEAPILSAVARSRFQRVLAEMRWTEGRWTLSLQAAEAAVAAAREHRVGEDGTAAIGLLGEALNAVAFNLDSQGVFPRALAAGQEAVGLFEDLCASEPTNQAHQRDLSIALENVGRVLEKRGDYGGALREFERSRGIRENLCASEPTNQARQRELSIALENVGWVLVNRGDYGGALREFERSRGICENLCASEPTNQAHQRELSIALNNVGRVLEKRGDYGGALREFERSRGIRENLCASEPTNQAHQRELSIALENVGRVLENRGDYGGALREFERSRGICENLCASEPTNQAHQREFYLSLYWVGRTARKDGQRERAVRELERARDLCRGLVDQGWTRDGLTSDLAEIERELSLARGSSGPRLA